MKRTVVIPAVAALAVAAGITYANWETPTERTSASCPVAFPTSLPALGHDDTARAVTRAALTDLANTHGGRRG